MTQFKTQLEMVYLMNVALYLPNIQTIKQFIQVNHKCKTSIKSLRISKWYNFNDNKLFQHCETLRFKNKYEFFDLFPPYQNNQQDKIQESLPTIKRIQFDEPIELHLVPKHLRKYIVNGIGFPDDDTDNLNEKKENDKIMEQFQQLETFTYEMNYSFYNLEPFEKELNQLPWEDMIYLPKLKRIILKCSYSSTPFSIEQEEIREFNKILANFCQLFKRKMNVTIEIQIEYLDDWSVLNYCKNSQIVISYNGELSSKIINSILNQKVYYRKGINGIIFTVDDIQSQTMQKLMKLYYPLIMCLRPFNLASKYFVMPLQINQYVEEEKQNVSENYVMDLTECDSLLSVDILLSQQIPCKLPKRVKYIETNIPIINLNDLQVEILDMKSSQNELILPTSLIHLTITHSQVKEISELPHLKELFCFDCNQLEKISLLPQLEHLSLKNCDQLTHLEISSTLNALTSIEIGIKEISLPTSITSLLVDKNITITNENELSVMNKYKSFSDYD